MAASQAPRRHRDDDFQYSSSSASAFLPHKRTKISSTPTQLPKRNPNIISSSNLLLPNPNSKSQPLKPSNPPNPSSPYPHFASGKENKDPLWKPENGTRSSKGFEERDTSGIGFPFDLDESFCLDSIESSIDIYYGDRVLPASSSSAKVSVEEEKKGKRCDVAMEKVESYKLNSLESRLLNSIVSNKVLDPLSSDDDDDGFDLPEAESCSELDVLLKLCDDGINEQDVGCAVHCPLCGADISNLPVELRVEHTNDCLDNDERGKVLRPKDDTPLQGPGQVVDVSPERSPKKAAGVSPVMELLHSLNLAKYETIFAQEEIDWDTLQWLTEEDLISIGITALGPRKKIVNALGELRKGSSRKAETTRNATTGVGEDTNRSAANKLITDFFPGSADQKRKNSLSDEGNKVEKSNSRSKHKKTAVESTKDRKFRDIPQWCSIPGTPFRVDAFKYLRRDCSHWFLTHFHIDHYQGLTRSFSHGKIYCSLITAKLVNMKLGIPWDKLQVLPLNQKINVAGIDVTCFDANHCPGAIIVLFEPPSGKAILHTGDFRFSEEMTKLPALQTCPVQTLILDTTYCNPQYDFPEQEAVIQFVIEAIQAEAFNQKTLFLIGSYTIGKERLFLEVARTLRKKVYVAPAKLRIMECLGLPMEDLQYFTSNERESHIHVVPMWTLASFKRLKCMASRYANHYSLIVAFSPTGWTFGKGKTKKSTGRRWQQGTIVRYEVPYSEHSSFTELKEFVKFISPDNIIPSVNNNGPEAANAMVSLLLS